MKKVKIIKVRCERCGHCIRTAPGVFGPGEEATHVIDGGIVPFMSEKNCVQAMNECPNGAITFDT